MVRPLTVTDATFKEAVLESDEPALVLFWAEWNATCKAISPSIAVLADEYAGRARVAKLDVDANPATPALFGVMNVPTLLLFAGGRALDRIVGYRQIGILRAALDGLLSGAH